MTIDDIRIAREAREVAAKEIADTLPNAHYYAADNEVRNEDTGQIVYIAASHWDAVLIMTAAHGRIIDPDDITDAYGHEGEMSDCTTCDASWIEYDETCVTCGGFGWVRA